MLSDEARPDRLAKKFQMGGGKIVSSIPYTALVIIGVSILGVFSSILVESTLRKSDPDEFKTVARGTPSTNRRLLFLHGIVGLAVDFAIMLAVHPKAAIGYDTV